MAHFKPLWQKTSDDKKEVRICLDGHHAWFVERPSDRDASANPLGAFRSHDAAKTWADHNFPGGDWQKVAA